MVGIDVGVGVIDDAAGVGFVVLDVLCPPCLLFRCLLQIAVARVVSDNSFKPRRAPPFVLLTLDTHHSARPEIF